MRRQQYRVQDARFNCHYDERRVSNDDVQISLPECSRYRRGKMASVWRATAIVAQPMKASSQQQDDFQAVALLAIVDDHNVTTTTFGDYALPALPAQISGRTAT